MGEPSPRCARRAEPQQSCESALDAFTLAVQCGGCGVPVSDSGREPGFGAPRLPALRFVRMARAVSVPGPACNDTRHGSTSLSTEGFPGCRVSLGRSPAAAASPFERLSPHRIRCGPSCLRRGVCPQDIAIERDTALDCALRRSRRRQPTTLPVAALWMWMAAPYHAVTKAALRIFLAIPLPPLARRLLLPPVTTRFPHSAPRRRPSGDRRHAWPEPPRILASRTTRGPLRRPRSSHRSALLARGHHLCALGARRGGRG